VHQVSMWVVTISGGRRWIDLRYKDKAQTPWKKMNRFEIPFCVVWWMELQCSTAQVSDHGSCWALGTSIPLRIPVEINTTLLPH
jgi:uncharacterized membrane protein